MIVDSSALVAIIRDEPDARGFTAALVDSQRSRICAATWFETAIVVYAACDPVASLRLDEIVRETRIEIEPFTAAQARIAREAYRDFGRGSGHRAQLNFGDCFAYALAAETREPLLYKGEDFVHTDLTAAELPAE